MIIEKIISFIGSILIVTLIPHMIYFNIVHFVSKWKCRKKKYKELINPCYEKECKWAQYCDKYQHIYTAEELQKLRDMIKYYQQKMEQTEKA